MHVRIDAACLRDLAPEGRGRRVLLGHLGRCTRPSAEVHGELGDVYDPSAGDMVSTVAEEAPQGGVCVWLSPSSCPGSAVSGIPPGRVSAPSVAEALGRLRPGVPLRAGVCLAAGDDTVSVTVVLWGRERTGAYLHPQTASLLWDTALYAARRLGSDDAVCSGVLPPRPLGSVDVFEEDLDALPSDARGDCTGKVMDALLGRYLL